MEITGTLVKHLPNVTGNGQKGPWIKREFVLQPPGQYDKPFPVQAFGDKGDVLEGVAEGEELTVHFNIEGREWNDKWYSSISAWKIEIGATGASSGGSEPKIEKKKAPPGAYKVADLTFESSDESNDLPF